MDKSYEDVADIIEEIEGSNSEEVTKCGDIFCSTFGEFIFCCYFCDERYWDIVEFQIHMQKIHLDVTDEAQSAGGLSRSTSNEYLTEGLLADYPTEQKFDSPPKLEEIEVRTDSSKTGAKLGPIFPLKSDSEDENTENHDTNLTESSIIERSDFTCSICELYFTSERHLAVHERTHLASTIENKRILQSEIENAEKTESAKGNYDCTKCKKSFLTLAILRKHQKTHDAPPKDENSKSYQFPRQPRTCKYCGEQFKETMERVKHERSHTEDKPFQCTFCTKVFRLGYQLRNHIRTHTGEKPYQCPHCPDSFALRVNLTIHVRRYHLKEKLYKCDHCEKSFVTSTEKKIHMNSHTAARPYECPDCDKKFSAPTQLSQHKYVHLNIRRYVCEVCSKSYFTSAALRDHRNVHSSERSFKCKICQKAFFTRATLNSHRRVHSDNKPHVCPLCGQTFKLGGGLTNHLKRHEKKKQVSKELCE